MRELQIASSMTTIDTTETNLPTVQRMTGACPLPLRDYPQIVLGHGGGGKLSAELIEHLFLPRFGNSFLNTLGDSTQLLLPSTRIAISTDSFVVQPLFFPGGSIGHLAVNGTVNDLAMSGAKPLYLTAGFILEEGLSLDDLTRVVDDMAQAASSADVKIIAGDTKVVQRGHGDGCYISTSGIGIIADGVQLGADQGRPNDAVIVSGTIGDHGMAVMSVREGLEFEAPIVTDSAPLADLVHTMLQVCPSIRCLRDPTRGGLATSLNEIAAASACGIVIQQDLVPIDEVVQAACEFLGLDPWLVANEGKLIAIVPEESADSVLITMRSHPLGQQAAIIGKLVADRHHLVIAKTSVGTHRIVATPVGEQLPRIC